jgi:hypothetical protein
MLKKEIYDFVASQRRLLKERGLTLKESTEIINSYMYGISFSEIQVHNAEYYRRPEVKERIKEYRQRPDVKKRIKDKLEEYYQRPGVKKRIKLRKSKSYLNRPNKEKIEEKLISEISDRDYLTESDLKILKPYANVISYLSKPYSKKFKSIKAEIPMKSPRSIIRQMSKLNLVKLEDKRYELTELGWHINNLCKWFMEDDIDHSLLKPDDQEKLEGLFETECVMAIS